MAADQRHVGGPRARSEATADGSSPASRRGNRIWLGILGGILLILGVVVAGTSRPGPSASPAETSVLRTARAVGRLPAEGPATVGGVRLPAGRVEYAISGDPIFWSTDDEIENPGDLWLPLAAAFPETGLWPLIFDVRSGRPITDAMGFDGPQVIDPRSVRQVAEDFWFDLRLLSSDPEEIASYLERIDPFQMDAFPGLASGSAARRVSAKFVSEKARGMNVFVGPKRLGLVAVTRPADVVLKLGWANGHNGHNPPSMWAVMLRSWEVRFGAYVVGLGGDTYDPTMEMFVERPPTAERERLLLAAEMYGFAPDVVDQGTDTVRGQARSIAGSHAWTFFWD